mmetsp:Transcript_23022/g.38985  ORF Transcript_23022/g.38985 Transcript_23022/m.38985 type:complete len:300 (+) Transcript_23022:5500-6399(+)
MPRSSCVQRRLRWPLILRDLDVRTPQQLRRARQVACHRLQQAHQNGGVIFEDRAEFLGPNPQKLRFGCGRQVQLARLVKDDRKVTNQPSRFHRGHRAIFAIGRIIAEHGRSGHAQVRRIRLFLHGKHALPRLRGVPLGSKGQQPLVPAVQTSKKLGPGNHPQLTAQVIAFLIVVIIALDAVDMAVLDLDKQVIGVRVLKVIFEKDQCRLGQQFAQRATGPSALFGAVAGQGAVKHQNVRTLDPRARKRGPLMENRRQVGPAKPRADIKDCLRHQPPQSFVGQKISHQIFDQIRFGPCHH